jgi:hypothetical protein
MSLSLNSEETQVLGGLATATYPPVSPVDELSLALGEILGHGDDMIAAATELFAAGITLKLLYIAKSSGSPKALATLNDVLSPIHWSTRMIVEAFLDSPSSSPDPNDAESRKDLGLLKTSVSLLTLGGNMMCPGLGSAAGLGVKYTGKAVGHGVKYTAGKLNEKKEKAAKIEFEQSHQLLPTRCSSPVSNEQFASDSEALVEVLVHTLITS